MELLTDIDAVITIIVTTGTAARTIIGWLKRRRAKSAEPGRSVGHGKSRTQLEVTPTSEPVGKPVADL